MRAALVPAGIPMLESRHWSLAEYRAVQDAFTDAHSPNDEPKVPYPNIEDFRKFKREWKQKQDAMNGNQ